MAKLRHFAEMMAPQRLVTQRLLQEVNCKAVQERLLAFQYDLGNAANGPFSSDLGGLDAFEEETCTQSGYAKFMFLRLATSRPDLVKGQAFDGEASYVSGESVIVELPMLLRDHLSTTFYLWSEAADTMKSMHLLAPSDELIDELLIFRREEEKFYFLPGLRDLSLDQTKNVAHHQTVYGCLYLP
jgi:hypothetical protein